MKKMSLFMAMIAFISITTSCEQDLQSDTTVNAKSGFNAESEYFSLKENTESRIEQMLSLSNEEFTSVWKFKYSSFKEENETNLSTDQLTYLNGLISYLNENSLSTESKSAIWTLEQEKAFLYFNDLIAISLVATIITDPVYTEEPADEGGRYTGWAYQMNSECHAQVIGGDATGHFVETITVEQYRRGKLISSEVVDVPCGTFGYVTSK
jgi:hypothetical protein